MRIIYYFLIVFVMVTALFFYLAGTFTNKINFDISDVISNNLDNYKSRPAGTSSTTGKNYAPLDFRGPTGEPHIIGPKGPPPSY